MPDQTSVATVWIAARSARCCPSSSPSGMPARGLSSCTKLTRRSVLFSKTSKDRASNALPTSGSLSRKVPWTQISGAPTRKRRPPLSQEPLLYDRTHVSLPRMQLHEVHSDSFLRNPSACRCIAHSRSARVAGSHGAPGPGLLPRVLPGADHRNRSAGNSLLPQLSLLFFGVKEPAGTFRQKC